MKTFRSIPTIQKHLSELRAAGRSIGFVPTMGDLHEGHLSLIRRARDAHDIVVLSIFVNPAQFGPEEDLLRYPRNEKKDKNLARKENVDIIFYPSEKSIYPTGFKTFVEVEGLSEILCGHFRPGHFRGVTTVVLKLIHIVQPHCLYLGQKDAQQAIILKRMILDLNLPVQTRICPIIRDRDGLALSSRNQYLSPTQRKESPVLFNSLQAVRKRIREGERSADRIFSFIRRRITNQTSADIEYISCVDSDTLEPVSILGDGHYLIALAARFGTTRLIDNIMIKLS